MKVSIPIADYTYNLPDERIAKFPLQEREKSKLLLYKGGDISEDIFASLPKHIPQESLLVFNNTRVIPARLLFQKQSGARIEVFCLSPINHSTFEQALASHDSCEWLCTVGNLKRWKESVLEVSYRISSEEGILTAEKMCVDGKGVSVRFSWTTRHCFSEVMEVCGQLPIPPYLKRETEEQDKTRYQTVYARYEGSVAAPTAGLHFSDEVLLQLKQKGVECEHVCLHVGAGTFKPVKSVAIDEHEMHSEQLTINLKAVKHTKEACKKGKVIAVGTTSVRTLESLYYIGCMLIRNPNTSLFEVEQWAPYENDAEEVPTADALDAIVRYMNINGLNELYAATSIMIVPGYKFKVVGGLITNFHQPQSTLLLLIAALIGNDWQRVYDYALANGFRFLSYGDSSLLLP